MKHHAAATRTSVAITKEFEALEIIEVWVVVVPCKKVAFYTPSGCSKPKLTLTAPIIGGPYNARLLACGIEQLFGVDYGLTC